MAKKSVREKVEKDYPEFSTEVAGLSIDELNSKLASLAKGLEDSENHKDDNEDLNNAKALASELAAPYRDVKKAVQLKSKYVIALLREKGGA